MNLFPSAKSIFFCSFLFKIFFFFGAIGAMEKRISTFSKEEKVYKNDLRNFIVYKHSGKRCAKNMILFYCEYLDKSFMFPFIFMVFKF